MDLINMRL